MLSEHLTKIKEFSGIFAGLVFYVYQSISVLLIIHLDLPISQYGSDDSKTKKQLLITWHQPVDKIHSICSDAQLSQTLQFRILVC